MRPERLLPGTAAQPLGVWHAVRHYLKPEEMWQDIASELPPEVQPLQGWQRISFLHPRPCDQRAPAAPALAALWPDLGPFHSEAYAPLVERLAEPLPEPPPGPPPGPERDGAPGPWVHRAPSGRGAGVWACHAGRGVLVEVYARPRWPLRTAYRNFDFKLKDYECPPRDRQSVERRTRIAGWAAERRIALLRARDEP